MSRQVENRIDRLLGEAEGRSSCVALASGPDRRALQRRAANPDSAIFSPRAGLFARRHFWDALRPDGRALAVMRGLALLHPTWVFCGVSAAIAHGLPVSYHQLARTHVVCGRRSRSRSAPGIVRHQIDGDISQLIDGLAVTSFRRTVFDCLATLPFDEALAVADAALRRLKLQRGCFAEELADAYAGCRGVGRALDVLAWAEPLAENGGESIARARMIMLGAEVPRLQIELPNPEEPRRPYRVDYCWRDHLGRPVFGELDGLGKYEDEELMGGRDFFGVVMDERDREALLSIYHPGMLRFSLAEARRPAFLRRRLSLFGVHVGEPPRLERGVPMPPKAFGRRSTILANGTKVLTDGMRLRFEAIAGPGRTISREELLAYASPKLMEELQSVQI